MINTEIYYTYNDIALVPSKISEIKHRRECYPYCENGKLPIFTAPMSTVVNEYNFDLFEENNINAILPRNINLQTRVKFALQGKWAAFSLKEFEDNFTHKAHGTIIETPITALIDVANGHMKCLYDLVAKSKKVYKDKIIIMIGNIANPRSYEDAYNVGADYVRVGIGSGCGCFVGNTLVTLEDGSKKTIKDVTIGEKVKTLHGSNQVLSKKEIKADKLIKINNEVTCTTNHKFLVVKKDDLDKITEENLKDYTFFLEAEKLDKNIHVLVKNV